MLATWCSGWARDLCGNWFLVVVWMVKKPGRFGVLVSGGGWCGVVLLVSVLVLVLVLGLGEQVGGVTAVHC